MGYLNSLASFFRLSVHDIIAIKTTLRAIPPLLALHIFASSGNQSTVIFTLVSLTVSFFVVTNPTFKALT